ncbi:hypothetical protein CMV_028182 [Castanea mollissima]|uniref:Protein kinase domain-containing protein n=1 Tax=Castanea mollissima TaxID=60419 RepID=A0A8J4V240_9ROSI|nr:hypothetical protein CMV_028182 [Castanea mollissima]
MVVGCKSECNGSNRSEELKCSGFNCCQSTIPSRLQVFSAEFRSKNFQTPKKECKYAFLVYQQWFRSNMIDPTSVLNWGYVPVALDWAIYKNLIQNSTEMFELMRRRSESNIVNCYAYCEDGWYGLRYPRSLNWSLFSCDCAMGYKGNPYLSCQDINECEDPKRHTCQNKWDCQNTEGSYNCNKRKSQMKIVIIVISTSLGVLSLLIITWCLYKVIKKRNEIKHKENFFKRNGGLLLQQQLSSGENNVQKTKLFNSKELENATDGFNESRILGKGGQGTVYKGMLVDGRIVAIKKCNTVDEGNLEQFINEIIILSQINHRNVVKLLGCCLETKVPLLVYEFIPNGTLFQYLHEENEEFPLLTWDMRLRIATEVAGALSYLHSPASLPIYHRDIKSSNILLDDNYKAKVADFGTSRSVAIDQTHVTTLVYGTFGYLDPEYFQTSQFTDKSDVYSFGVVLIELLTREKPVSSIRSQESRNLSTYFVHSLKENRLFDILDTQVSKVCNKDEVMAIANLAKRCLHLNGKKRPSMIEIVMELEGIQKVSHVQPNFDELEYVRKEEMGPWNDVSISASSCFELESASSVDVLPLLSYKSV